MSFMSSEEAEEITRQVIDVHRLGGFHLRNFRSNCPAVLCALCSSENNEPVDLRLEESPEKILGMFWETKSDEFTFKVNMSKISPDVASLCVAPTKRQVLSVMMSVFDPFGILCDFMLYANAKLLVELHLFADASEHAFAAVACA